MQIKNNYQTNWESIYLKIEIMSFPRKWDPKGGGANLQVAENMDTRLWLRRPNGCGYDKN
jgi:hypothetical protein